MNSIVNNMPKYNHWQHVLSDWLADLGQRFQLGEVGEDKHKIAWCQLLIGATGSSILSRLEDDASWETAKETMLSRLGIGSVKDEAWTTLKNLKKGAKEIVELAGEAETLAKRLHPRDEEAAERQAIDAFQGALERPLAAEVQKLGYHTMESVVMAARRIEKILAEQTDSEMERRLLKKDLEDAREQIANPTAALTANTAPTVAAATTRNTLRRTLIIVHRTDNRTGDLHAASSVEKRGTSPPTVQPAPSSSASYSSKHTLALAARLKYNSQNRPQPRTAPK